MATNKRFEDLEIWKKSRILCKKIYLKTKKPEFSKDYSPKNQIKRSSVSIKNNIAEGFEREGNQKFINYLYIAKDSFGGTGSQVYRAFDFEYIDKRNLNHL